MNRGRTGFLVFFLFLCFNSCVTPQSGTDFYDGLKQRHNEATTEAIACFEKALHDINPAIAAAAAAELMSLHLAGAELSAPIMSAIHQKAAGSWAQAFDALRQSEDNREQSLAFLFSGESRSLDEAAHYALQAWRNSDADFFTNTENAAIDGRIAISRSRYNEALLFFRIALHDSPDLFFRYPDLITDLGRAFQYTATGTEGMDLLLQWEALFDTAQAAVSPHSIISADSENMVRFRLLFFAARIARQRGEQSVTLFERALPFARAIAPEQSDACIWYILDSPTVRDSGEVMRYLETYIPQWHDDSYFSDVMDKIARNGIIRGQWEYLADIFALLKERQGTVTAQYAWIISRAVAEGFLPPEKADPSCIQIAYNAGVHAWYYRSLSAAVLGEPFLVLPQTPPEKTAPTNSDITQFLLGFFENDAAPFASRYIRAEENNLSGEELYLIAAALGAAEQYQESMRLVSLYTKRAGYQINRKDLELLYPYPFKELVEQFAEETGIEPPLLYGLIRTESAFNHTAVSRAGAVGLTQLMPATAQETAARIHRRGGPDYTHNDFALELYNPAVNIHIGAAYLAYLDERMEDTLLALLAYNGGINRVRRWHGAANRSVSGSLPPDLFLETVEFAETRNYGRYVIGAAAMYRELYY